MIISNFSVREELFAPNERKVLNGEKVIQNLSNLVQKEIRFTINSLPENREKISVALVNSIGQIVYSDNNILDFDYKINIEDLESGLYVLVIQKSGVVIASKKITKY